MYRFAAPAGLVLASILTACTPDAGEDAESAEPTEEGEATHEVRLTVTVPADAPAVYVSGNLDDLGPWNPAGQVLEGEGTERTTTIHVPHGFTFEYKFTLGSWDREAVAADETVPPNHELYVDADQDVAHEVPAFKRDPLEYFADWEGSGVLGTLVYWPDVPSSHLSETRHVEVWLPPGSFWTQPAGEVLGQGNEKKRRGQGRHSGPHGRRNSCFEESHEQ